jgi:hypothetical protein
MEDQRFDALKVIRFLLEQNYLLTMRVEALEQHRHDDFGRVFSFDGVMCRYLGGPVNQGTQQAQPSYSAHQDSTQSAFSQPL